MHSDQRSISIGPEGLLDHCNQVSTQCDALCCWQVQVGEQVLRAKVRAQVDVGIATEATELGWPVAFQFDAV